MHRRKRDGTQQLVIPKGMILPGEAAVIEIPRRYQRAPIIIMKRKGGVVAHMRAEDHFIPSGKDAPQDVKPPDQQPPQPAPVLPLPAPIIKPEINFSQFEHNCSIRGETAMRPLRPPPQQSSVSQDVCASTQQSSPVTLINQCGIQASTCPPQPSCSTPRPSGCTHVPTCPPSQLPCSVPRPSGCTHVPTCPPSQPSCSVPRPSGCTHVPTCPPPVPLCSAPRPRGCTHVPTCPPQPPCSPRPRGCTHVGTCPPQPSCSPRPSCTQIETCPPSRPSCAVPRPSCTQIETCPPSRPLCSVPRPSCTQVSTCPPVRPKPSCGSYTPPCNPRPQCQPTPCFPPTSSGCSRNINMCQKEQCELEMVRRSLDEFQKARRRLLYSSRALKEEMSQYANSNREY
nr:PREDICTED: salivary glue protein Sgs-4 isoform X2 [Tribolium castaneum]|eukprot:XP_015838683.1 PREDICTED: salivary glue protein Sgs-4 isoform X2 [Tribolium castaneum]